MTVRPLTTTAVAVALAVLGLGGCGGAGGTTEAQSSTERVVTAPSGALVARGRTLRACLVRADLGGQPAQLTPIDLRTAVVGVGITDLPLPDGAGTDAGGIIWLFESAEDAEDAVGLVTAPVPGEREQYIQGAAIVVLYEGAAPAAIEVLRECLDQVAEPEDG